MSTSITRRHESLLVVILAAGFVLRLVFVIAATMHQGVAIQVDSFRYLDMTAAQSFSEWFVLNGPPGYALFLALTNSTLKEPSAILYLQLALSTGSLYLLYRLGSYFLRPAYALIATAIYALAPLSALYASQVMSETVFTFLLLAAILLLLSVMRSDSVGMTVTSRLLKRTPAIILVASGLMLGVAVLVRPSGLILVFALGMTLLVLAIRKRIPMGHALLFCVASMILIVGYMSGMKLRHDYFGLTVNGSATLSSYYAPVMMALGASRESIDSVMDSRPIFYGPKKKVASGEAFAEGHNELFRETLREHPILVARVHVQGALQMLFWPPLGVFQLHKHFGEVGSGGSGSLDEMDYAIVFQKLLRFRLGEVAGIVRERLKQGTPALVAIWLVTAGMSLLVSVLAITGLLLLLKHTSRMERWNKIRASTIIVVVISYVLIVPHIASPPRFRVPLEPLLALLCSYAFMVILGKRYASKLQD